MEIFGDEEPNRKKGKASRNTYKNTAKRSYDDAPKESNISMKREKNLANRVFSQGKGKEEHRKKEKQAKQRRQQATFFEPHVSDQTELATGLERGELFEGMIRFNAKFRDRAFVVVKGFTMDVMVEGPRKMNRSMDGDIVAIRLDPVAKWPALLASQKKAQQSAYANNQAVETRVVDGKDSAEKEEEKVAAKEEKEERLVEEGDGHSSSDWSDDSSLSFEAPKDGRQRVYHVPGAEEVKLPAKPAKRQDEKDEKRPAELSGDRESRLQ